MNQLTPEQYSILLGLVWAVKNRLFEEDAKEQDLLIDLDDIEKVLESKAIRAQAFTTEQACEDIFDGWNLP